MSILTRLLNRINKKMETITNEAPVGEILGTDEAINLAGDIPAIVEASETPETPETPEEPQDSATSGTLADRGAVDEGQEPLDTTPARVIKNGACVRTYTFDEHGPAFRGFAKGFAEQIGGRVE